MNTRFVFRPLDGWDRDLTSYWKQKSSATFTAGYEDTLELLDREIQALGAVEGVIQLALPDSAIRRDGLPRSGARPSHEGVALSFDSRHGPLRYATDTFDTWQANLRAIALGLEALRKVDRYGIAKSGEQYAGWNALPSGDNAAPFTVDAAARFIAEHAAGFRAGGAPVDPQLLIDDIAARDRLYRAAARRLHPDAGGDPSEFRRLNEARDLLDEYGRT